MHLFLLNRGTPVRWRLGMAFELWMIPHWGLGNARYDVAILDMDDMLFLISSSKKLGMIIENSSFE